MLRYSGLLAARPSSQNAIGTAYFATDEGDVYLSAGGQWIIRPAQRIEDFVGFSSVADYASLPSAAGNIGWLFETTDDGKLFEAFPGAWYDASASVEGLSKSKGLVVQSFSNANVTVTGRANRIVQTGTMSAARTVNLEAASAHEDGAIVIVTDHSGTVSASNKIVISANGADTIDGAGDDVEIFTANGDYALMSNGVDGWETVSLGSSSPSRINAQTGTSYTLVLSDADDKIVTMNNAGASTWTIPTNAEVPFSIGSEIPGIQLGAGTVTIDGAGVTLRSLGGLLAASAQYASWCALKIGTDEWVITGQLA